MRAARRLALPCVLLLAAGYGCGEDELPVAPRSVEAPSAGSPGSNGGGEGGSAEAVGGVNLGGGAGVVPSAGQGPMDPAGWAGAGCSPEPVAPELAALAHGLALRQIAVLQAVKIPIMEQLIELAEREAEVLTARPALFRAYVKPANGFRPRSVRARLTLLNDGQEQTFEDARLVSDPSSDADLASTFNFQVPPEFLQEEVSYSLELFETEGCTEDQGDSAGARFPVHGVLALRAEPARVLRVQLVPVAFGQGENALLPDLSAEQLELMRKNLVKVFPIADVDLSVREQPLSTTATNMVDLLDQVAVLRDQENVDVDLTYYGVVRFQPNLVDYCSPSCVLGASFIGETPSGGVGVGIGYSGDRAAMTFVHELGHVYGRPHSPCGVAGDPAFPYSGGRIGSWGYDVFDRELFDPFTTMDFMGYCAPRWVSDHTYEQLRSFIADIGLLAARAKMANKQSLRYRTLIMEGAAPRWGRSRSMRLSPAGWRELATMYDANGATVTSLEVFRRRVAGHSAEVIYVPEPFDPRWVSLKLTGQALQSLPQKFP